jgi:hypothetical protein
MTRIAFLTCVGTLALAIGVFAVTCPAALLAGKGVAPNPVAQVWVREVGVLILASGVFTLLVRKHPNSPTLRAFLFSSALLHAGLLPIEIAAWISGVLARLGGILPNSALHVVIAGGFLYYALTARRELS